MHATKPLENIEWRAPIFRIALTGGISSGKSTILEYFSGLERCFAVSADDYAHHWLRDADVRSKILSIWGDKIRDQNSLALIDRKKLAAIIFHEPQARKQLNNILHRLIQRSYQNHLTQLQPGSISVYEVPILLESFTDEKLPKNAGKTATAAPYFPQRSAWNLGLFRDKIKEKFDCIVVISAKQSIRKRRAMAKRKWSEKEFYAREKAQLPLNLKEKIADTIICNENEGNLEALALQVKKIHSRILEQTPVRFTTKMKKRKSD